MKIEKLLPQDIQKASKLWNDACVNRMPYMPLTEKEFEEKFFENVHFNQDFLLAAKTEDNQLAGFIIACCKKQYLQGETFENTPVFITMLLVDEAFTRQGVGTALLQAVINESEKIGKRSVRISYRNPINLSWIVPNTTTHTHNNAPGVELNSEAYCFFKQKGFVEEQIEYGMHLPLENFTLPQKYYEKIENLQQQNIEVTLYDAKKHHGFEELFDAVKGEVWRKTIQDNLAKETPLPIIVAVYNDKIVGFAGPIDKEPSGRGWFNGIATHPQFERKGIAYVMFCRLMAEFKEISASFSTLFTDEKNPASALYFSVGFEVAKKWAVMNKEIICNENK